MRIVYFGTPEFAAYALEKIAADTDFEIAAVVTAPDKPAGRGHKMLSSDVKKAAERLGLPLLQPANLKAPEFVEALRALEADLFVVIAFRMMPEVVWAMPPKGTFNLHGSLLPKYRGAAPINRAVMAGETETGVTTFFLQQAIDTGEIIDQARIAIGEDENVGSVHDRLMVLGADLTVKTLKAIADGTVTSRPQDDVQATQAPKIFKPDCRIDWSRPQAEVHNLIRGLSPYPGAWAELPDIQGEVKVLAARRSDESAPEGRLTVKNGRGFVGCGDGRSMELLEVQPSGKRRMDAAAWIRGLHL